MPRETLWIVIVLALGLAVVAAWTTLRGPERPSPAGRPANEARSEAISPGTEGAEEARAQALPPAMAEAPPEKESSEPPSGADEPAQSAGPEHALSGPPTGEAPAPPVEVRRAPEAVTIGALLKGGARYEGKEVVVRGKIVTLCVRGCQFTLADGTGVVAVELVGAALERTVPRGSLSKTVEVRGVFRSSPRPHISVDDPEGWWFK